jgi:hypothetical protein
MRLVIFALVAALPLSACDSFDPYDRPGSWRPADANAANLRAMLVEPDELFVGTSERGSDGQLGAAAVERFRTGQDRQLPASRLVDIGAGGG